MHSKTLSGERQNRGVKTKLEFLFLLLSREPKSCISTKILATPLHRLQPSTFALQQPFCPVGDSYCRRDSQFSLCRTFSITVLYIAEVLMPKGMANWKVVLILQSLVTAWTGDTHTVTPGLTNLQWSSLARLSHLRHTHVLSVLDWNHQIAILHTSVSLFPPNNTLAKGRHLTPWGLRPHPSQKPLEHKVKSRLEVTSLSVNPRKE